MIVAGKIMKSTLLANGSIELEFAAELSDEVTKQGTLVLNKSYADVQAEEFYVGRTLRVEIEVEPEP